MAWTSEKIEKPSPSDRANLYANARKSGKKEGIELAERIEKLELWVKRSKKA